MSKVDAEISSETLKQHEAIDLLVDRLEDNDALLSKLEVKFHSLQNRSLHVTQDIKEGEMMAYFPEIITSIEAKKCFEKLEGVDDHSLMAFYLLDLQDNG